MWKELKAQSLPFFQLSPQTALGPFKHPQPAPALLSVPAPQPVLASPSTPALHPALVSAVPASRPISVAAVSAPVPSVTVVSAPQVCLLVVLLFQFLVRSHWLLLLVHHQLLVWYHLLLQLLLLVRRQLLPLLQNLHQFQRSLQGQLQFQLRIHSLFLSWPRTHILLLLQRLFLSQSLKWSSPLSLLLVHPSE